MIINSQKRSFGRGAKVSLFTLGTMRATESLEKMYNIIKNAYYVGINHIETAPSYGDAESLIGNSIKKLAIEENIKEKNWVITSKVLPKGDFDFLKNNFKKSIQDKAFSDKPLVVAEKNQKVSDKNIFQEIKKNPSSKLKTIPEKSTSIISYEFKELNSPSPSLEDIRSLINGWLLSKSNYLAGKSEINLSKIISKGLIDRTIEERQKDIKKGIYKEINSQIRKIDLESQTSSRIVVLVELNYLERIVKNSGEFVNETSLTPLKVKYIFGFSNKSWKLVDFVSGL